MKAQKISNNQSNLEKVKEKTYRKEENVIQLIKGEYTEQLNYSKTKIKSNPFSKIVQWLNKYFSEDKILKMTKRIQKHA